VPLLANIFTRGRLAAQFATDTKTANAVPVEVLQKLRAPALALTIVAVLEWVMLVALSIPLAYWGMSHDRQAPAEALLGVTGPILAVIAIMLLGMSTLMLWGAAKMRQGEGYGLAILACILAMVMAPANLIGLPVGIWALVVLLRPEVKAAFR